MPVTDYNLPIDQMLYTAPPPFTAQPFEWVWNIVRYYIDIFSMYY